MCMNKNCIEITIKTEGKIMKVYPGLKTVMSAQLAGYPIKKQNNSGIIFCVCVLLMLLAMVGSCTLVKAEVVKIEGYTVDQWADAIYWAENSHKHPYGILAKYKHTSPRQACINTLRHKHQQWLTNGRKGTYIAFLASKYSPIGCDTDLGTNKYWKKNVQFYLDHHKPV